MAEYTFNTVSIPIGGDTPEAQYLDDRVERARQRFYDKHGPEIHALVMSRGAYSHGTNARPSWHPNR